MKPLKEATAEKHRLAEQMAFNIRMASGEMNKDQYLLYLSQQSAIFSALEDSPLPHQDLRRSDKIKSDIEELFSEGYDNAIILSATSSYVTYLNGLSDEERLPHVYLNYLAQMFGGQMMKKVVPSQGKMYEFDNMRDAMLSIRQIQKDEWADEVNKGFDFHIAIFADLEEASKTFTIV
jgi:heme oxygenase